MNMLANEKIEALVAVCTTEELELLLTRAELAKEHHHWTKVSHSDIEITIMILNRALAQRRINDVQETIAERIRYYKEEISKVFNG